MNTAGESVLLRQKSTKGTGSLFHEAPIPVMTDENTSQNDNNDWSLFHRTRNDKWPVNCITVTHKSEPFDKGLFHKDILLSQSCLEDCVMQ